MSAKVDLTGSSFGCLTVIEQDGRIGKTLAWKCKCECGNTVRRRTSDLNSLRYPTCICDKMRPKRHDLKGKVFGRLLVIEEIESKTKGVTWRCLCDCGNEKITKTSYLVHGKLKSCGCLKIEVLQATAENLTGMKFGRLTVIEKSERIGKYTAWKCLCDCGKYKNVKSSYLKNNETKSCGCLQIESMIKNGKYDRAEISKNKEDKAIERMVGSRQGNLEITRLLKYDKWGKRVWECLCDCGKICKAYDSHFKTGVRISCGCLKGRDKWTGYMGLSGDFFKKLRRSAEARDLEFNLTKEYLWELFLKQEQKCALTGVDLFLSKSRTKYGLSTASLDRIDSDLGYIEGNVQFVHKYVNIMKRSLTDEFFIGLCKLVVRKHDPSYIINEDEIINLDNTDLIKTERSNRKSRQG